MENRQRPYFIYVLYGTKKVITQYRSSAITPLLEDPFEFTVKRYELYESTRSVIEDALIYSCYTEISEEEYYRYHRYLCQALDLIFTKRLLTEFQKQI